MEIQKFTANLPTKKRTLENFQNPRGLREGDKRVLTYDVKIDKRYNKKELILLSRYLQDLIFTMENVKLN